MILVAIIIRRVTRRITDALSVKLDVLGLPVEALPPHPDNHDTSNEDDPKIESLFPSTFPLFGSVNFEAQGQRVEPFTFAAFYSSRIR